MLYNLPNGKTIYLTIEEYLNLTDGDVQFLMAIDAGTHVSPFFNFSNNSNTKLEKENIDLDYLPDDLKEEDIQNLSYEEDFDDLDFSDPSDI